MNWRELTETLFADEAGIDPARHIRSRFDALLGHWLTPLLSGAHSDEAETRTPTPQWGQQAWELDALIARLCRAAGYENCVQEAMLAARRCMAPAALAKDLRHMREQVELAENALYW